MPHVLCALKLLALNFWRAFFFCSLFSLSNSLPLLSSLSSLISEREKEREREEKLLVLLLLLLYLNGFHLQTIPFSKPTKFSLKTTPKWRVLPLMMSPPPHISRISPLNSSVGPSLWRNPRFPPPLASIGYLFLFPLQFWWVFWFLGLIWLSRIVFLWVMRDCWNGRLIALSYSYCSSSIVSPTGAVPAPAPVLVPVPVPFVVVSFKLFFSLWWRWITCFLV